MLEEIRKSTREMINEQEAVRGRLFTIQDVMQSTVRAWLQVFSTIDGQNLLFPKYANLYPLMTNEYCLHTWIYWKHFVSNAAELIC